MTIKKLSKKEEVKKKKVTPEEFIKGGGKVSNESNKSPSDEVRFSLRISKRMINEIDQSRKSQVGSVSRNTWILQTISEKLALK